MKIRLLLRLFAFVGLAISAYLLFLKLTGRISYLVGCGAGSGCANVLGSRWSPFFYVTVTALSTGMYLALLASTWKPSRPVMAGLAVCFVGAALWFYGILLFELKSFCPWCASAHFIGLCCAFLLWQYLKKDRKLKGKVGLGVGGGALAVIVMIVGQVYGPVPETHAVSTETIVEGKLEAEEVMDRSVHARGGGRLVNVLGDGKFYNTSALPHIGPADAPHVLVEYFDYTCASCHDMHKILDMVLQKHPGKFCVILLPVPLNRTCNEFFPPDIESHEYACELARLALAAWRADPEAFPDVHALLFNRPVLTPELADIALSQIVGEEALAKARKDPWVEEVLTANKNDFKQLTGTTAAMPKLLAGKDQVFHGMTSTPEILLRSLEKAFALPADP